MLTVFKKSFTILFLGSFVCLGQNPTLVKVDHPSITIDHGIYYLPKDESFITLQLAAVSQGYWHYDDNLITISSVLGPIFLSSAYGNDYFSIGMFHSMEAAKEYRAKINCLFASNHPVPVAYENGKTIPFADFKGCTVEEQAPDVDDAIAKLKELVYQGYYRVQIGYYEKPGLPTDEQEIYKKLESEGVKIIQEPYQNGRLYLTKKKYVTYGDAKEAEYKIRDIIGRYACLKAYGKPENMFNDYLWFAYSCLKDSN